MHWPCVLGLLLSNRKRLQIQAQQKIESTMRHLGIDVDDAFELSEDTDI